MKTILYLTPEELRQDLTGVASVSGDIEFRVVCHALPAAGWPSASDPELSAVLETADAIVTQRVSLSAGLIEKAKKSVVIVHAGEGSGGVDLEAARRNGIYVSSVPDYATESFVRLTLSVLQKRFDRTDASVARPARLGVIGLGCVGRRVAEEGKLRGWEVLAHDPFVSDEVFRRAEIRRTDLYDLLGASDAVSLHLPRSGQTRAMIDRNALALMPENGFLLNTGDPSSVEIEALLQRLEADDRFCAAVGHIGSRTPSPLVNRIDAIARTEALEILEIDFSARPSIRRDALKMAIEVAAGCLSGRPPDHMLIDPALPRMILENS